MRVSNTPRRIVEVEITPEEEITILQIIHMIIIKIIK